MRSLGVRHVREQLPTLVAQAGDAEPVMVTRHGRPVAAILPPAAVEVWQRHLQAEADRARQAQEEECLGQRLPGKRTPVCPVCGSSYLHVIYKGPVAALVNTADPGAGVQAVVVDTDPSLLEGTDDVRCASCWEPLDHRPRHRGHPAHTAAGDIADDHPLPPPERWEPVALYTTTREDTRSSRIVLAHDLARGEVIRVTRWEWLTGITDAEREQMRAERQARGEDPDDEADW